MPVNPAANAFFRHFVGYLNDAGYSARDTLQHVWRPYELNALNITGPHRDVDLNKLALGLEEVHTTLATQTRAERFVDVGFYSQQKIVLVIVPGFTHETLRNYTLHEELARKDSPHEMLMLSPGVGGGPSVEKHFSRGPGFKVVYAKYPRSNAASEHINLPLFELLHHSASLRRWVQDEGYKVVFLGYSYGCPLTLELLADMASGRVDDHFLLHNTLGFLAMCGAIGGAYLAEDVLKENSQVVSVPKLVEYCRKHPWAARLAGLSTDQFKDDMVGGVQSLTRAVRQAKLASLVSELPSHVHYASVGAVMPMQDYKRQPWHLNLDDYTMYLQAKVSAPHSVYNDGQVVLEDMLIPHLPQVPEHQQHHLGAVRAHHWSVAYRTFNFGWDNFPRRPFYRALIHTLHELGISNPA